jgi:hypothetical protein
MKRMTLMTAVVVGAVMLLGSIAGAAKPDMTAKDAAKAECKAAKKADKRAFKATYGSMARCVKGEKSNSAEEIRNAAQECRAEQEADPAAFAAQYGSNYNAKNAFGKCVSSKVQEDDTEDPA